MSGRYFFHADTTEYGARLQHILIVVIMPLLAACVFCTVNLVLNYRSPFATLLLLIIGGSVLLGMSFTFAAVYVTEKHKRRHSKYTFFDFLPSGMIFSEYAGEYAHWGKHVILRRLYYIPFERLESVSRDPKTAPHDITFKGEIRKFYFETDRLGYHIDEDGEFEFDTVVLNYGMYDRIPSLTIRNRFGNTKKLEKSVLYYLEQFKNIPEKKPFDISEYISVRKKRKPNTSNPALEAPSFSRNWK